MDSKTFAIIAIFAFAISHTWAHPKAFEDFKVKHGKVYANAEEETARFAIWTQNHKDIKAHNDKGTESHTKGENQFTDLTHEEFKSIYLGHKTRASSGPVAPVEGGCTDCNFGSSGPCRVPFFGYCLAAGSDGSCSIFAKKCENTVIPPADEPLEAGEVNWLKENNKVQKIKNQGQCGSCWAFSTVSSCESADAIFRGTLGDFSEQQLVDCAGSYGNNGCNGGNAMNAFDYLRDNFVCTESSYPYTAKDGVCKADQCTKASLKVTSYNEVPQGSLSALKNACKKQPVSIAVDASQWNSYHGGILKTCGTSLDHAVVLVGFTKDYWLVRNSWGTYWGEDGYIRLAAGNTCGLANSASTVVVGGEKSDL